MRTSDEVMARTEIPDEAGISTVLGRLLCRHCADDPDGICTEHASLVIELL
jgi:hypothetical protein